LPPSYVDPAVNGHGATAFWRPVPTPHVGIDREGGRGTPPPSRPNPAAEGPPRRCPFGDAHTGHDHLAAKGGRERVRGSGERARESPATTLLGARTGCAAGSGVE
jgi:hypothetical protein